MSGSGKKSYRIYRLDGALHIVTVDELEADGDEEAVAAVQAMDYGLKCEIWDADRMVARLERGQPPA